MSPHFVYLPKLDYYVNLAIVGTVEQRWDHTFVRTTLPDGQQPYEDSAVYPDHYSFAVYDSDDRNILCRALRHFTINTHEAPTAEKVQP